MSDQDQKLAEIQRKRAALAEAREARQRAAQIEKEAKSLEIEETLNALEEAHGPAGDAWDFVLVPAGVIAVKKATAAEYQYFVDQEKTDLSTMRRLVKNSMIFPEKGEDQSKILDEYPGVILKLSTKLSKLSGYDPKG